MQCSHTGRHTPLTAERQECSGKKPCGSPAGAQPAEVEMGVPLALALTLGDSEDQVIAEVGGPPPPCCLLLLAPGCAPTALL